MTRPVHPLIQIGLGLALLSACTPQSTGGGGQGSDAVAEAQRAMVPSHHVFVEPDKKLLWEAVDGYMNETFPIDAKAPGYVETSTMEWVAYRLPHRTRVIVELEHPETNPKNTVMHVCALKIEPSLDAARFAADGASTSWNWVLSGQREEVEEVVLGQIVRRYLLLRAGKDPSKVPFEEPIPGLSPRQDGYFKPGKVREGR